MVVRALLACSALVLVAGCGRTAPPPTPAAAPAAAAPAEKRPPTLEERMTSAAPKERPATMAWDRVLPGMTPEAIAAILGRPDEVRGSADGGARLAWRTGSSRDPLFLVWLHDGVATRMRFVDRF